MAGYGIATAAAAIHVDARASGAADGSSWQDAFPTLQAALAAAPAQGEIWVAGGIYHPDRGPGQTLGNAAQTFRLGRGIRLLGGFSGSETEADDRNPGLHPTILSGDLGADDLDPDHDGVRSHPSEIQGVNSAVVITCDPDDDGPPSMDGFVVTGGDSLILPGHLGSALVANRSFVTVTACRFVGNRAQGGGAVFVEGGSPVFRGCTFAGNRGGIAGALLNMNGEPLIDRCRFIGNEATQEDGTGGALIHYSYGGLSRTVPVTINSLFSGNRAAVGGAVLTSEDTDPLFINCTFAGNEASVAGGAVFNAANAGPGFLNCVFSGNRAAGSTAGPGASLASNAGPARFRHSVIAGSGGSSAWNPAIGMDEGSNLDADPRFVSPAAAAPSTGGDYRLLAGSPAIDHGDDSVAPPGSDLAGRPRVQGAPVDAGAYEGGHVTFGHLFPDLDPAADDNGNGLVNFIDYIGGADPRAAPDPAVLPALEFSGGGWTYRFMLRDLAGDGGYQVQCSDDLETWERLREGKDYQIISRQALPGRVLLTLRFFPPPVRSAACFWRLDFPGS
jgi:hypothetical protein